MANTSTLGFSPERLARLLGITFDLAGGEARKNEADTIAQLLEMRLSGSLPLDTRVIDELPVIIGKLRDSLLPHGGKSLGDVLNDPESDLDMIKKVRRYAKKMASQKKTDVEHAVDVAVYFAAIANALVFHDVKITTHSYQSLETSLEKLIDKPWMSSDLTRLFAKARKVCKDRRS